jgi:transcriptional regulator with XRE-family HTH domain
MNTIAAIWGCSSTSTIVIDPSSLGEALRKARKAVNITQEELSLQTGISRTTIRLIEQGKQTAQVGLVLQLCRDLGLTLSLSTTDGADKS